MKPLRCRKCRKVIIDTNSLVSPHGSTTDECESSVWYIQEDKISTLEWIKIQLDQSDWTKGRLICPYQCGTRIGSYDFIHGTKCSCNKYVVPSVHLVKSRIDLEIIGPAFNSSLYSNKTFSGIEVSCYPWHINNKYYEADIFFIHIPNRDLISSSFAECIQAIIIHCDNKDESKFNQINLWQNFIDYYQPEIRILVVDTASDDAAVPRERILRWCISKEFELVEIEPEEVDEDYEEDFKENNGLSRIMQAIQAHTWPFMLMKTAPNYTPSPKFEDILNNERCGQSEDQEVSTSLSNNLNSLNITDDISNVIEESFDGEDIESFFEKFAEFKRKAESLKGPERRKYAEKITMAFWEALGGEKDEFDGLDEQ